MTTALSDISLQASQIIVELSFPLGGRVAHATELARLQELLGSFFVLIVISSSANTFLSIGHSFSSETEKHLEKVIKRNEEMVVELKANGQPINDLKAKLNRLKEINDQNEIERKARDLQIAEVEAKLKAEMDMAAKEVEQFSQKEIKWKTDKQSLEVKLQNIMGKLEHLEQSRNFEENTRLMERKEENLRLQGCLGNAQSEICDHKT
ncbi:hypothetical protein ACOME3_005072 [Neoechinorhynchus agilis]